MKVEDVKYTAKATATGGRDGRAWSESKVIDVSLSIPKQLGEAGLPGTNPEKLFAAGYSACFFGSMTYVAARATENGLTSRHQSRGPCRYRPDPHQFWH